MRNIATATRNHFPVAPRTAKCKMTAARYTRFHDWTQLTMNARISVVIRAMFAVACLYLALAGKPPAAAQVSSKDEMQDVQLGQLSEFKANQQLTNAATETMLQKLADKEADNAAKIESIEGWQKGGFGVLTGLSILAMFFQFRKQPGKHPEAAEEE